MGISFVLAIISVICGVVSALMITSYLSKQGIKINYWLLRIHMLKYLKQYRNLTTEENGKPGNLFYAFIAAWILAIVFAVIGIVIKNTGK